MDPALNLVSVVADAPAISLPLGYSEYWIAVWTSAAIGAIVYAMVAGHGTPLRRIFGFALLSVPIWTAIWGFINSIPVLTDGGSVLAPRSTYRLSSLYIRSILIDIGYLGAGFLLWIGATRATTLQDIADRLRDAAPVFDRTEGRGAWLGFAWFPVLLLGTYGLDLLVRNQLPALINGDESQAFRNMTIFHSLLISAAAAVTEELTYRVLLLGAVFRFLRRMGARGAMWWAVVLQAVVFGLAHGGYGTIYHVLGPLIFGLIAGFSAVRFGIWSAIMLHFLIDVFAFGVPASQNAPGYLLVLWALLLATIAAAGYAAAGAWRDATRKPQGPAGE